MKAVLTMTAVAALVATASVASAQEGNSKALEGMYGMKGSGGNMVIMGPGNQNMGTVIVGEGGMAPANCPAGSYYSSGEGMITACGAKTTYRWRAVKSGEMMKGGEAYPEGAMVIEEGGM